MKSFFAYFYRTSVSRYFTVSAAVCIAIGLLIAMFESPANDALSMVLFFMGTGLLLTAFLWGMNTWLRKQLAVTRAKSSRLTEGQVRRFDELNAEVVSLGAGSIQMAKDQGRRSDELNAEVLSLATRLQSIERENSRLLATVSQERALNRESLSLLQAQQAELDKKCEVELSRQEAASAERHSAYLGKFVLVASGRTTPSDLLNRDEVQTGGLSIMTTQPLVAYSVFQEFDLLAELSKTSRRNIATKLRGLGYWGASLELLHQVVGPNSSDKDLRALELRTDELKLFSGEFEPALLLGPVRYQPMQGHVLHVVGKARPKTQTGYTIRTHYTAMAQQRAGFHVSVVSQVGENETPAKSRLEYVDGVAYYSLAGKSRLSRTLTGWLEDNIQKLDILVQQIRPSLLHAHADFLNVGCYGDFGQ